MREGGALGATNFRANQEPLRPAKVKLFEKLQDRPFSRRAAKAQLSTSRLPHELRELGRVTCSCSSSSLHHLSPTTAMASPCRFAARSCARQLRSAAAPRSPAQAFRVSCASRRYNSTEAEAVNPKIADIVDQISKLTLLETADLVSSLKVNRCPPKRHSLTHTRSGPIAKPRPSFPASTVTNLMFSFFFPLSRAS